MLFDNGGDETLFVERPEQYGKFSRGLELELDYETMTARKVWEYRHRPDHISATISSVQRLPNGHTLVNFGRRPVTLVEADEEGNNGVGHDRYQSVHGLPASVQSDGRRLNLRGDTHLSSGPVTNRQRIIEGGDK